MGGNAKRLGIRNGQGKKDFTEILMKRGKLSADQRNEAISAAKARGVKLAEAITQLGYCQPTDVMAAIAEENRMTFVDLETTNIPQSVVELVPEAVARRKRGHPTWY